MYREILQYYHHLKWRTVVILISIISSRFAIAQTGPPENEIWGTRTNREARMRWFKEAQFGMFIHWGLYSIPANVWQGEKSIGAE